MENKRNKSKMVATDRIPTRENAQARYEEFKENTSGESSEQQENPVEAKIKQAMAEGAFDNLPGKGKPLDIGKYLEVPEHLRTAYHILRNAGYLPEEVRLKKEMEGLKEQIKNSQSEQEKQSLVKELAEVSQQFYFYMDYNKQFKK